MVTEAETEFMSAGTIDTLVPDTIVQLHVTPFAVTLKSAACAVIVSSAKNSVSISLRAAVGVKFFSFISIVDKRFGCKDSIKCAK